MLLLLSCRPFHVVFGIRYSWTIQKILFSYHAIFVVSFSCWTVIAFHASCYSQFTKSKIHSMWMRFSKISNPFHSDIQLCLTNEKWTRHLRTRYTLNIGDWTYKIPIVWSCPFKFCLSLREAPQIHLVVWRCLHFLYSMEFVDRYWIRFGCCALFCIGLR